MMEAEENAKGNKRIGVGEMNKEAIKNTALCYHSTTERCFIVESPLFDMVIGAAPTEKEAWEIFNDLLDETYVNYLEGKLAGYTKAGRPKKNRIGFHAEVKPESKESLKELADKLACSQGEVIDFLLFSHSVKPTIKTTKPVQQQRRSVAKKTGAVTKVTRSVRSSGSGRLVTGYKSSKMVAKGREAV